MVQEYMDNQVNKMGEMFTIFMQKKLWCPISANTVSSWLEGFLLKSHLLILLCCPPNQVREIFRWMSGPERGGQSLLTKRVSLK